jgi:hypothetical protein
VTTPQNRPGQPALRYRVATHGEFLTQMLEQLSSFAPDPDDPALQPLRALTTRDPSDPAIALLDAFAVAGDVLTFYQERIANEGFLRTATERRSVLELARSIGYELSPGVSASAWLAFTVEDAKGAPLFSLLPQGTKVQSVPGPGEQMQVFETSAGFTARAEWNALRPLLTQPQDFAIKEGRLYLTSSPLRAFDQRHNWLARQIFLAGTGLALEAGDLLLVEVSGEVLPFLAVQVVPDAASQRTRVDLAKAPSVPVLPPPLLRPAVIPRESVAQTPGNVQSIVLRQSWEEQDLESFLATQQWDAAALLAQARSLLQAQAPAATVYAFRQHVGFFGHNAPAYASLPVVRGETTPQGYPQGWDDPPISIARRGTDQGFYSSEGPADVWLEREVPEVTAGSWTVFRSATDDGETLTPFPIESVTPGSRADFALSGKSTGLGLTLPAVKRRAVQEGRLSHQLNPLLAMPLRRTTAYVQSVPLPLSTLPFDAPLEAAGAGVSSLTLDRMVLGLAVGQAVLVSGSEAGDASVAATGVSRSEVALLGRITHAGGLTTLGFTRPLTYRYLRSTVAINANVVQATNGETVPREVMGSGDGAQPNQRFVLKKPALTYTAAATPSGAASTLTVRVDGVAWDEEPTLYGLGQRDRAYVLRNADDGTTTVIFGDGVQGARLPSGRENLTATYRTGIGLAGEVSAGKLTILPARPLGLRGVTNPLDAAGAAAPETLDGARANAPRAVLTLDRIVSLDDYENFAAGFAGIGKAQAVAIWSGRTRLVHLTVAGNGGDAIATSSPLFQKLTEAMAGLSDGQHLPLISSYLPRRFHLAATLAVDPAFELATVHAAALLALSGAFAFEQRAFGQAVTEVEIIALLQSTPGVVFVKIDRLFSGPAPGPGVQPASVLPVRVAHWEAGAGIVPAELLLPAASGISLVEVRP